MADEKPHLYPQNCPPATSAASAASAAHPLHGCPPLLIKSIDFIGKVLDHWTVNLVQSISVAILTLDSLLAAYRARRDPWIIVFALFAYVTLQLFFWCIRAFEKAPPGRKWPLMVAVCALGMFLITLFSYRMAPMMPFGFAVAIWSVVAIAIMAGLYSIFVFGCGSNAGSARAGGEKATGKERQS